MERNEMQEEIIDDLERIQIEIYDLSKDCRSPRVMSCSLDIGEIINKIKKSGYEKKSESSHIPPHNKRI